MEDFINVKTLDITSILYQRKSLGIFLASEWEVKEIMRSERFWVYDNTGNHEWSFEIFIEMCSFLRNGG